MEPVQAQHLRWRPLSSSVVLVCLGHGDADWNAVRRCKGEGRFRSIGPELACIKVDSDRPMLYVAFVCRHETWRRMQA